MTTNTITVEAAEARRPAHLGVIPYLGAMKGRVLLHPDQEAQGGGASDSAPDTSASGETGAGTGEAEKEKAKAEAAKAGDGPSPLEKALDAERNKNKELARKLREREQKDEEARVAAMSADERHKETAAENLELKRSKAVTDAVTRACTDVPEGFTVDAAKVAKLSAKYSGTPEEIEADVRALVDELKRPKPLRDAKEQGGDGTPRKPREMPKPDLSAFPDLSEGLQSAT